MEAQQPGFLSGIWWCSQSGDHSKNNLAKFGYILDRKVERKKESLYILGYLLELIIKIWQFGFFILRSNKFGPFFPWIFFFYTGQNHNFSVQNSPIIELSNWLHFASWQNDFQISFIIGYPMCNFVVQMCFCSFLFGAGRGKKGLQLATYLFMWCINLITCLRRLPTPLPNVPTYLTRLPINLLN